MNIVSKVVAITTIIVTSGAMAQGGGTLGGNAGPDSGAVNVSIGKCTIYKLQVKEAAKQDIDTSTVVKPKGC